MIYRYNEKHYAEGKNTSSPLIVLSIRVRVPVDLARLGRSPRRQTKCGQPGNK